MVSNAETLFEPKAILDCGDWLLSHKEGKQSFDYYYEGNGGHKWLGGQRSTIYLFCIDETITKTNSDKYKLYAEAMYPGAKITVIRQGEKLPNGVTLKNGGAEMPKNFLKETKVTYRHYSGCT